MDQKLLNQVAELLTEYGVEDEEQVKSFIEDLQAKLGVDNDEPQEDIGGKENETANENEDNVGEESVEETSEDVVEEETAPESVEEQPQEPTLEEQPIEEQPQDNIEQQDNDFTQQYDSKINELNDTIATLVGRIETLEDVLSKLGHLKGDTTQAGIGDVDKKQEVSQELPMDEKELKYRRALGM